MAKLISFCLFLFLLSILEPTKAYPLFTSSRWIVDGNGQRVKLACVNWPSHLQPVVAEGLSKQPLDAISKKIVSMGFNCVRLTWPLDLMTNDTLARNITVRQSFQSLKLFKDIDGIQTHNPSIIDLPLINAFQEVVSNLGSNGVMVILDNHLTKPGWCCSDNDLDAFFGYPNFDPSAWIFGLKKMATMFYNVTNVIGMSLRNELRGSKDYPDVWYKYMQQGAEAVHAANPNVLVILSGIDYDTNLSFLQNRPVNVSFTGKLVFELHWYSFSDGGDAWIRNNPNDICAKILRKVRNNGGFLLERGFPLFLNEFGTDERGGDVSGNRYMNCLLGWAAENDVDWAVWALTGDYYLREGKVGLVEYYGVLDANWKDVRNSSYLQKLSGIQPPLKGPGSRSNHHNLIFHPSTGLCITLKSPTDPSTLVLGPCQKSDPWTYNPQGILQINNGRTALCLEAADVAGKQLKLGTKCLKLEPISESKMHLSFTDGNGASLCLDVDAGNNVVANLCKCLSKDSTCDPASQWFKIL